MSHLHVYCTIKETGAVGARGNAEMSHLHLYCTIKKKLTKTGGGEGPGRGAKISHLHNYYSSV